LAAAAITNRIHRNGHGAAGTAGGSAALRRDQGRGTDGVYIFRYQGHQAMFIVTKDGVIATDPIGERRPAAKAYIRGNPRRSPRRRSNT